MRNHHSAIVLMEETERALKKVGEGKTFAVTNVDSGSVVIRSCGFFLRKENNSSCFCNYHMNNDISV